MDVKARILIVDDDDITIGIITSILQDNGFSTCFCHNGEEALKLIAEDEFKLVLLDVYMGAGMDGYETCLRIRKTQPDLPVILVTADNDDESINRGFEAGSSDYLRKPVSKVELLARVDNIIALKQSEQNNIQLIDALQKDLTIAAGIQKALLPKWVSIDSDLIFSSYYEASTLVGGDLFDWIKLDENRYAVYVGDVSGHGVQAALLMTAIKSSIKYLVELHKDDQSLAEFFTNLNTHLCSDQLMENNYVTLVMGVMDISQGVFRFLSAGHPPPILIDSINKNLTVLSEKGSVPLCWMADTVYTDEDVMSVKICAKDIVLLYTDGIYESVNTQNTQLSLDGLKALIKNRLDEVNCVNIPYGIKHYMTQNSYATSNDDFTLFVFQIHNHRKPETWEEIPDDCGVNKYSFVIPPQLKEVESIAVMSEQLVLSWIQDKELAAKTELIVDEFLYNIILHAYDVKKSAEIVVELRHVNNKLTITFWDKGIDWSPALADYSQESDQGFDWESYKTEGRGMKIITSLCSRVYRNRYHDLNETKVEIDL